MKENLYNVYDLDGTLIFENKTSDEIARALDVPRVRVAQRGCEGRRLNKRYKIEKVGIVARPKVVDKSEKKEEKFGTKLIEDWEKTTEPFKKIIWVKEWEPGVRRLRSVGAK